MRDEFTSSSVLISTPMAYKEKCRIWLSKHDSHYEDSLNSVSFLLYKIYLKLLINYSKIIISIC